LEQADVALGRGSKQLVLRAFEVAPPRRSLVRRRHTARAHDQGDVFILKKRREKAIGTFRV
jgi:hypothetical protein